MSTSTEGRLAFMSPVTIAAFSAFIAIGALIALRPATAFAVVATLVTFALVILLSRRVTGLELWQTMVLTALTGYMVLGYGFQNLAFHLGIPLILGHGLMFAALGLAFISRRPLIILAFREPVLRYFLVLIPLTVFRLFFDIPRYGMWALRDASIFLEGIFLVAGYILAIDKRSVNTLLKWLMVIFVLNLIYSCSYPWGEALQAWSPKSGVFQEVPLFGDYGGQAVQLLVGALFCILIAQKVVRWPRWILLSIAALQLSGLAIFQSRAMYLALFLCLVVLVVTGEVRRGVELMGLISLGVVALLCVTSLLNLELAGRVGPVRLDFIKEHASGLLGNRNAPAAGSLYGRLDWYDQVFQRLTSSTTAWLVGDGFGEPLIDFSNNEGTVVRQPHNSHLTVLARLGVLGMVIWILFHLSIVKRFIHALRHRYCFEPRMYAFILWLFLYYIILSLDSSVEAGLEFSFSAIPYYLLAGFALGLIRWQMKSQVNESRGREKPVHS